MDRMKYRIFDKNNKCFLPDSILLDNNLVVSSKGLVMRAIESSTRATLENMSDHLIAQQSTGYIFKGAEVYEGDIFKIGDDILKVAYVASAAAFVFVLEISDHPDIGRTFDFLEMKEHHFSLCCIGNILTHPEYLEKT